MYRNKHGASNSGKKKKKKKLNTSVVVSRCHSYRSSAQCAQRWKKLKWTISYFSTFGGFIW